MPENTEPFSGNPASHPYVALSRHVHDDCLRSLVQTQALPAICIPNRLKPIDYINRIPKSSPHSLRKPGKWGFLAPGMITVRNIDGPF